LKLLTEDRRIAPANCHPLRKNHRFPYMTLECRLQGFGTMIADLLALSDWLAAVGVTHGAMESTGESSTPVYNILEESFTVFLVNAAHVKQVPGHETDKADAR
jgi:transposase